MRPGLVLWMMYVAPLWWRLYQPVACHILHQCDMQPYLCTVDLACLERITHLTVVLRVTSAKRTVRVIVFRALTRPVCLPLGNHRPRTSPPHLPPRPGAPAPAMRSLEGSQEASSVTPRRRLATTHLGGRRPWTRVPHQLYVTPHVAHSTSRLTKI